MLSVVHEGSLTVCLSGGIPREREALLSDACSGFDELPVMQPANGDAVASFGKNAQISAKSNVGTRYGRVTPLTFADEEQGLNLVLLTSKRGNRTAVFAGIGNLVAAQVKLMLQLGPANHRVFDAAVCVFHGLGALAEDPSCAGMRLVLSSDQAGAFVAARLAHGGVCGAGACDPLPRAAEAATVAAAQVRAGVAGAPDAGPGYVAQEDAFAFRVSGAEPVAATATAVLILDTGLPFVRARHQVPVVAAAVLAYLRAAGFPTAEWNANEWANVCGLQGVVCGTTEECLSWDDTLVLEPQGTWLTREPEPVAGCVTLQCPVNGVFSPVAMAARPNAGSGVVPSGATPGSVPGSWLGTRFGSAPGLRTPVGTPGPWGLAVASPFGPRAAAAALAVPGMWSGRVGQTPIKPPCAHDTQGSGYLTRSEAAVVLGAVLPAGGIPLVCATPGVPLAVLHWLAQVPRAVVVRFGGDGACLGTFASVGPATSPVRDEDDASAPLKRTRTEPVQEPRLFEACAPWRVLMGLLVAASGAVPGLSARGRAVWLQAAARWVSATETGVCDDPKAVAAMGQLLVAAVAAAVVGRLRASAPTALGVVAGDGHTRGSASGLHRSELVEVMTQALAAAEAAAQDADLQVVEAIDRARLMLAPEHTGMFSHALNQPKEAALRRFVQATDALSCGGLPRVAGSGGSRFGPGLTLALDQVVAAVNVHTGGITLQGRAGCGAGGVPLVATLRGGDDCPGASAFEPPCDIVRERLRDLCTMNGRLAFQPGGCVVLDRGTWAPGSEGPPDLVAPVVCLCWAALVVVPDDAGDPEKVCGDSPAASTGLLAAVHKVVGVGVQPRNGCAFVGCEGVSGAPPATPGWAQAAFRTLVSGLGTALAAAPAGGVGLGADPAAGDDVRGLPLTLNAALLRGAAAVVPGGPVPTSTDLMASLAGLAAFSGSKDQDLVTVIEQFLGRLTRCVAQAQVVGGPTVRELALATVAAGEAVRLGGARAWPDARAAACVACFRLVFGALGVAMTTDHRGILRNSVVFVVKAACVPALLAVLGYVNCVVGADPCVVCPLAAASGEVLLPPGALLPMDPVWPGKAATRVADAVLASWKAGVKGGALAPEWATRCLQWATLRDGMHDVNVRTGLQALDGVMAAVAKTSEGVGTNKGANAGAGAGTGTGTGASDGVVVLPPALQFFNAAAAVRRAAAAAEYAENVVHTKNALADLMTAYEAFSGGPSPSALCALVNAVMGTGAWFNPGAAAGVEVLPAQDCPDYSVSPDMLGRQVDAVLAGADAAACDLEAAACSGDYGPGDDEGVTRAVGGLANALAQVADTCRGPDRVWWVGKGLGAVCVVQPGFTGWPGPVVCMGTREWLPHALLGATAAEESTLPGQGVVGDRPRYLVSVGMGGAFQPPGLQATSLPAWALPCVVAAVHDASSGEGVGPGSGPLLPRVAVATVAPYWVRATGPCFDPTGGVSLARAKALGAAGTCDFNRASGVRFVTGAAFRSEVQPLGGVVPLAFTGFGPRGAFLHLTSRGMEVSMATLAATVAAVFSGGGLQCVVGVAGGVSALGHEAWCSAVAVVPDGHGSWKVEVAAWAACDVPVKWFLVGVPPMGHARQLHTFFACSGHQHSLGAVSRVLERDSAGAGTETGSALLLPAGGLSAAQGWVHFATTLKEGCVLTVSEVELGATELADASTWAAATSATVSTYWMQSPRLPATLEASPCGLPPSVAWSLYVWPKCQSV